jgi:hypothetical protein
LFSSLAGGLSLATAASSDELRAVLYRIKAGDPVRLAAELVEGRLLQTPLLSAKASRPEAARGARIERRRQVAVEKDPLLGALDARTGMLTFSSMRIASPADACSRRVGGASAPRLATRLGTPGSELSSWPGRSS